MRRAIVLLAVFAVLLATGCSTEVKRVDTDTTIDLSGKWNDADSRMVADEMIEDSLGRSWLENYRRGHGGKNPVVIVGTVRNRSHEHINTQTFVKDLERALINSGRVDFVASRTERDEIRDERKDQAAYASEETAKEHGQETGADFMLQGSINTIEDRIEGKRVMYYQTNLELIDLESNKKVWIGEKKIKKFIKQKRLGL